MNAIASLGRNIIDRIRGVGVASIILIQVLCSMPTFGGVKLFITQMSRIALMSLLIISISGLFIGLVLGLQSYSILINVGSETMLGALVSLRLLREMAPAIVGILFAGCVGSALTAEIGLMKATEQLSSMEMIGVDPLKRIVSPRFWACVISLPMLAIIFSVVGIIGGKLVGVEFLGIDEEVYWSAMKNSVHFYEDVIGYTVLKSFVFSILCAWIAVYQGYACDATSEGISKAATRTVVYSSLCVFGSDFMLTAIMFGGV